jgi:hypothetical protein
MPRHVREKKPDLEDVRETEALRNAHELRLLREGQQKAMEDMLVRADKLGPEEAAAAKEEMRRAMEEKFKEQEERLEREQDERARRQMRLYER